MLARLHAAALRGVDAVPVTVEVRVDRGIHFLMVGLPDSAVRESQQRIKSAIEHLGFRWPGKGITINLAPAGLRKEGAAYDLPLALGILAASQQIEVDGLDGLLCMGELALDGALRPVRGALALAQAAEQPGWTGAILPYTSASEAALNPTVTVYPAQHLHEVLDHLSGQAPLPPMRRDLAAMVAAHGRSSLAPLAAIRGQPHAIEAMAVAAAGGHNVCMVGPPGAGKTLLAKAMTGLLPPLDISEAMAVNRIHSVASRTDSPQDLLLDRPFRSPHHTISDVALVGGGSDPRPGEISLAHGGVLFLDELPEMPRHVLEVLRQPLESRQMVVSRARATVVFPADFQLVAAMNPCPCGRYSTDPTRHHRCTCSAYARRRYLDRISGPLLDRIDIHLDIEPVPADQLLPEPGAAGRAAQHQRLQDAQTWQTRVAQARERQRQRNAKGQCNARLDGEDLHRVAALDAAGRALLTSATETLGFSARAHGRILRLSRTLADMDGRPDVNVHDLAHAIALRRGGQQGAAEDASASLFAPPH